MVDVDSSQVAPPGTEPAPAMPSSRNWAPLAESALKQAGLAAAVLYGVVSLGYRAFYDQLGVRPEEVGVDRAHIITQAAVALAIILGLASAIGLIGDLFFVPVCYRCGRVWHWIHRPPNVSPPRLPDARSFRPVATAWMAGLIVLPAAVATFLLYVDVPSAAINDGTHSARFIAWSGLVVLVWAAWRRRRARRHPRIQYKMWVALAALLGVVALLIASDEVGGAQARYLQDNGELDGTADAPGSLISFTAPCVEVTAVGQAPVPSARDRVLLLGSASSIDVIWDTTSHQVIRVPTSSVVLRSCQN
jgi:hypothetical protein